MSVSNYERRPDDDRTAYRPCDEAIYSDVQVEQVYRDSPVSHNGVPVASESYNDVYTSHAKLKFEYREPPLPPYREFYVEEPRVELVRHLLQSSSIPALDGATQQVPDPPCQTWQQG